MYNYKQDEVKIPHSKPSDVYELYCSIGYSIWMIQALENSIMEYLIFKHKIGPSIAVKQVRELFNKTTKRTLGSINYELSKFKEDTFISQIIEELNLILEERNWLVHKVYDNNIDYMYRERKRTLLFQKLVSVWDKAISLAKIISNETQRIKVQKGFWTEEELIELNQQFVNSWSK